MYFVFAALAFAALTAFAIWKANQGLLILAKPAVMLILFAWLCVTLGLQGVTFWFGLGMLFSLAGDILLIWPDRFFLVGLAAFLLAHISYLIGFNLPPSPVSIWVMLLAVIVGLGGGRLLRRILSALAEKGLARMRLPVAVYGALLSLMLLSAMLKLTDPAWGASASLLVALGAFLFFLSDIVLAWNRFVTPIKNGRMLNIAVYHIGQTLLAVGVILQFTN